MNAIPFPPFIRYSCCGTPDLRVSHSSYVRLPALLASNQRYGYWEQPIGWDIGRRHGHWPHPRYRQPILALTRPHTIMVQISSSSAALFADCSPQAISLGMDHHGRAVRCCRAPDVPSFCRRPPSAGEARSPRPVRVCTYIPLYEYPLCPSAPLPLSALSARQLPVVGGPPHKVHRMYYILLVVRRVHGGHGGHGLGWTRE
jgi:hypothetical protein